MAMGRVLTGIALLGVLATTPALAADGQQRDDRDRRDNDRSGQARRRVDQRTDNGQRDNDGRRYESQRNESRRYDSRRYESRSDYRGPVYVPRDRYYSRTIIVPRYVRPRVVTVLPYRPYVYRPRLGIGTYYGSTGYPYGYTPRGYFDPIPGRPYGGLRITDAPREAQVFADGYYVGIVNDFDGVFQHLNLEAGPHRIEIRMPGSNQAIEFDVVIQPGRTITFRSGW